LRFAFVYLFVISVDIVKIMLVCFAREVSFENDGTEEQGRVKVVVKYEGEDCRGREKAIEYGVGTKKDVECFADNGVMLARFWGL